MGWIDDQDFLDLDEFDDEEPTATCRYCGKGGLFWQDVGDKRVLFESVRRGGALPRKTFSMGEAREKRYYLECRRISAE